MNDTTLYATILGVRSPWKVTRVAPAVEKGEIVIHVESGSKSRLKCPKCAKPCPKHDHRARRWRHLPTCQYRTILEVLVPRVKCTEHGVLQVPVDWADTNSSFTALMEALVISWAKEASISAVARLMDLTWDQVDGIMQRAVRRGLARRAKLTPERVGIDETSFQKRHEYVSVVSDLDTSDVLYVADSRKKTSLDGFFEQMEPEALNKISVYSIDMWPPFILSIQSHVEGALDKICFDKFHVAKYLGDAVDKVRRKEQREMISGGDRSLVKTKYTWLRNP